MYHKITLIGNLGRDPEMRYSGNGKVVTNFSMATTEKWTGQDGQLQERTIWWRVSVFGKQAETANQYLKKGAKVYVEGRMAADPKTGGPRLYQSKDGATKSSFEAVANVVKFLSPLGDGGGPSAAPPHTEDAEDVPF